MSLPYEVYHVGNLAADRERDARLNALAEEYLERGTPAGLPVRPVLRHEDLADVPRGLGEGFLLQKRLWGRVFEYRYYPRASGAAHDGVEPRGGESR